MEAVRLPYQARLDTRLGEHNDRVSVAPQRHHFQPPIPVYPHVYPPKAQILGTQHPCAFPADLTEQVQNIE
jgi:hypothetical protein